MHAIWKPRAGAALNLAPCAVGLALLFLSDPLAGQVSSASIEAGDRIRFISAPRFPEPVEATLNSLNSDTLKAVGLDDRTVFVLPASALDQLEVRETNGRFALGAAIGGGLGLAAGVLFVNGICSSPDSGRCDVGDHLLVGLVFGAPTALAGGLVGAAFRSERWTEVSIGEADPPLADP